MIFPGGYSAQTQLGTDRCLITPPFKFAIGGVPLGNEFAVVTDKDAYAGVRYFDMAPWYGLGLAERRYDNFLHDKPRDEFIVSSRVGFSLSVLPYDEDKLKHVQHYLK